MTSCMPSYIALQNDPNFAEIIKTSDEMSKEMAIATIKSSLITYYKPQEINVNESGYGFSIHTSGKISGGVQPDGSVLWVDTGSQDFTYQVKFDDVIQITTSRWGAVDDAIAFGINKRWAIYLTLSDPKGESDQVGSAQIICYDEDKNKLSAALITLCQNLKLKD